MYESFFGFKTRPFNLSPDPGFYFGSKQHRKARAYLEYGVSRNEGFIVITGEIGAGKTTVLHGLIDSLAAEPVSIGQIVASHLDAENVLRAVGTAFGIPVRDVPKAMLMGSIEAFLLTQTTMGRRCLLVVDEAQNLSAAAVEELRLLSNFQQGNRSLLQTFLVGQPEFRLVLQRADMEQFRQRVAATCHIGPLDAEDTRAYVEHRLRAAGAQDGPTFDEESFAVLHGATGGVPRRINALMDRLLLSGFLADVTHFGKAEMNEVADELRAEGLFGPSVGAGGRGAAGLPVLVDVLQPGQTAAVAASATMARSGQTPDSMVFSLSDVVETLAAMDLAEHGSRLRRLEEGLTRMEHLQRETLQQLRHLVQLLPQRNAPAAPPTEHTAILRKAS